jgi:hypothetical protein
MKKTEGNMMLVENLIGVLTDAKDTDLAHRTKMQICLF